MAFRRRRRRVRKRRRRVRYAKIGRRYRKYQGVPLLGIPRRLTVNNPQFIRVKRTIDFLVPSTDLARGTYGVAAQLSVGPNNYAVSNTHSYASAAYDFRISDIPNVTEFGQLFDQYRITGIRLKFIYTTATEATFTPSATNASQQQCTMMIWNDFDDVTAPTTNNATWSAAQETGRIKAHVFPNRTNTLTYFLRPRLMVPVLDSAGGVTGRSNARFWCDGATALNAQYFGVKVMLQCYPSAVFSCSHQFRCIATYYTQWKNRQ